MGNRSIFGSRGQLTEEEKTLSSGGVEERDTDAGGGSTYHWQAIYA
jgi:hypothetical protein